MNNETEKKAVDRRSFFRGLGGAAAVAGAAVATSGAIAPAEAQTKDERRKARYRDSEHVRNFYRTNRY